MKLRYLARPILFLLILLFTSGCARPIAGIVAKYIVHRIDNMASFTADVDVVADYEVPIKISYMPRMNFLVEMKGPQSLAGERVFYDGTRFLFYSPKKHKAVLFKGLKAIPLDELEGYIKKSLIDTYENTRIRKLGSEEFLGRDVIIYEGTPREPKEFSFKYTTWMDKEYFIPLKQVSYRWPNDFFMAFAYTEIDFEVDLSLSDMDTNYIEGTKEVVVDFTEGGFSNWNGDTNSLGFIPIMPKVFPDGIQIKQIRVTTEGDWPIFSIYLESDIRHVGLIQSKIGPPLPVESWRKIRIDDTDINISNYFGLYLIQFQRKGLHYAIFGNLTFDKIMQLIRGL